MLKFHKHRLMLGKPMAYLGAQQVGKGLPCCHGRTHTVISTPSRNLKKMKGKAGTH